MSNDSDETISRHKAFLEIHKLLQDGKVAPSDLSEGLVNKIAESKSVVEDHVLSECQAEIHAIGSSLPDDYEIVIDSSRRAAIRRTTGSAKSGDTVTADETPMTETPDASPGADRTSTTTESSSDPESCMVANMGDCAIRTFQLIKAIKQSCEQVPKVTEFANRVGMSISQVSKSVSKLEELGLIKKADNNRYNTIELTDTGRNAEFMAENGLNSATPKEVSTS